MSFPNIACEAGVISAASAHINHGEDYGCHLAIIQVIYQSQFVLITLKNVGLRTKWQDY